MPPKSKITKEMIIDAAYEIVREHGESGINARTIAEKLKCSTQPVLYYFKTMDEIRHEVYNKVDEYHSEYLIQPDKNEKNAMTSIWKKYIRFSVEEKNLFKLLFQSNSFSGKMQGLFDDERLIPVLQALSTRYEMEISDVKKIFVAVYYPIHGIASLLANNSMEYNEEEYEEVITTIRNGVIKEIEREKNA